MTLRPRSSLGRYVAMLALGLAAGTVAGLLGIGGGILIVPGLAILLRFDQHRAHGTSLLAVMLISLSGAITYAVHRNIIPAMAVELAIGGVIGAVVGGRFVHRVDAKLLRLVFCALLVLVGVRMLLSSLSGADPASHAVVSSHSSAVSAVLAVLTGIGAGLLSSMLGLGGGIIMVPAMVMLLGVEQKLAQGCSFAAMVISTGIACLVYHRNENVDAAGGRLVGVGGIVGGVVGGTIAAYLPASTLRIIFSGFLVLIAVTLAFRKHAKEEIEPPAVNIQ